MSFSNSRWNKLISNVQHDFKKTPDVNGLLFLIGIQEYGNGFLDFSKEQKQDLMHIATCKILSFSGYYELINIDKQGWPIWKNIKKLPSFSTQEQEIFIKNHILEYFSDIYKLY